MSINLNAVPPPLRVDAHGVYRIANTGVTLLTVLDAFLEGLTPEEIHQEYSSLALADVYAVISYYLNNRQEIDQYLAGVRLQEAEIIRQIDSRSSTAEMRQRLLARKSLVP